MPSIETDAGKVNKIKLYIKRQREKRKQEEEQDAQLERMRNEREMKRKRDEMTLEEIRDQLVKLEAKLKDLKEEKHELFLQLKKVLNEDEMRKRQRETELMAQHHAAVSAASVQSNSYAHGYQQYYMASQLMQQQTRPPAIYHRISQLNNSNAQQHGPQVPQTSVTQSSMSLGSGPPLAHSIVSVSNTIKRAHNIKRPHERSPTPPLTSQSQPSVSYAGSYPNFKPTMSYTPNVPRTTASSAGPYQIYYPGGGPQSQLFDAKGSPYVLPSGSPYITEGQMEGGEYEAAKYYQQMRTSQLPPPPITISDHRSTIMPIQAGQAKPGGITSGYPVQRSSQGSMLSGSTVSSLSSGQSIRETGPRFRYY